MILVNPILATYIWMRVLVDLGCSRHLISSVVTVGLGLKILPIKEETKA